MKSVKRKAKHSLVANDNVSPKSKPVWNGMLWALAVAAFAGVIYYLVLPSDGLFSFTK